MKFNYNMIWLGFLLMKNKNQHIFSKQNRLMLLLMELNANYLIIIQEQ
jgi:hypothetical protein